MSAEEAQRYNELRYKKAAGKASDQESRDFQELEEKLVEGEGGLSKLGQDNSQTTEAFRAALDSFEQAKRQIKVWSGYDCSEIAEDIFSAVGEGQILRIEGQKNNSVRVLQEGVIEEFVYHEIFVLEDKVFDPRYANDPTSKDSYFRDMKKANEDTKLVIKDITSTK